MANKYRQSLIKAVAFYEGISQRKATTIVSSRIKQIRAINKSLKGSDIKLNPYRQFEREYFGGEETLYDRYQVIYERFDHFLDKYGNRDISFIYNNKAITNVETNKELNNIASIKEYLQNLQGYENVNIKNGIIESSNDAAKRMSLAYLGTFAKTYYSMEDNEKKYYTTKDYKKMYI